MILGIRTDKPVAELYLAAKADIIASYEWEAHRELADTIHTKIEKLLASQEKSWNDLTGLVVFKGPGSFTGLRIGITVADTIAYAQAIPIVGANGAAWLEGGLRALQNGENARVVLPDYGGTVHITKPKK